MPATLTLDLDDGASRKPLARRVLAYLLAGFSSRSYPLLGPMCIWLPYPPRTRPATRPPGHPDTGGEAGRH